MHWVYCALKPIRLLMTNIPWLHGTHGMCVNKAKFVRVCHCEALFLPRSSRAFWYYLGLCIADSAVCVRVCVTWESPEQSCMLRWHSTFSLRVRLLFGSHCGVWINKSIWCCRSVLGSVKKAPISLTVLFCSLCSRSFSLTQWHTSTFAVFRVSASLSLSAVHRGINNSELSFEVHVGRTRGRPKHMAY